MQWRGWGYAAAYMVLAPAALVAQGNLGGLTGNITDASGAVIAEAAVTLRSVATNAVYKTVSTSSGVYAFRALPPGLYELETEKPGFKKFVGEQVSILTATTSTLDIVLSVGAVNESVTVSGSAAALQTTSPEVSTVLERRAILDLPIEVGSGGATTAASGRRQPENFIFLTPGVSGIPWSKNINGSPDFTQEVLYDGISAQLAVTPGFLAQTSPPYEAVQEFKVQNSLFPAEYGRGLGVINFTLRSGTNQYHGDLFEFFRNDKLDARPFFAAARPRVRYNEFGGSFGGPLLIPKIYNGRDRTFVNFNYTGLRNRPPLTGNLISLPTAAFKQGDFSGYRDSSGAMIPIFDPATTLADGTRTPFPGNVIPANRISKVASNVMPLIPAPDFVGYFNNYLNRTANPTTDESWSIKVDQILTTNQRVSFSYWQSATQTPSYSPLGPSTPIGLWGQNPVDGQAYRLNYDYTIRPNLLQHFGYGYTYSDPIRARDTRKGNQIYQVPGVPLDSTGFPLFTVNNTYGSLALGNSDQQPNDPSINRNYSFVDNLTWIKGRHQFKFGVDIRFFQYDNFNGTGSGGLSGTFLFDPLSTANSASPDAARQGNGWASLLLGQVYSANRLIPAPPRRMRDQYYAWYLEDVWKVSRKFTLTLGLRHEIPTVVREASSAQSYLDLALPNPGAGGRLGALAFLKPGGQLTPTYERAFSPRIGIAYAWNEKTVIRSGFGMFWSPTNATSVGRMNTVFIAGFSYPQSFPQLTSGRVPALLLDNGIPPFTGTLPNADPSLVNGTTIDYMNPGAGKPGYVSSWTFDIQRELPAQFMLDIGYVGQRGVALPSGLENLNQVDFKYLGLGNTLNQDINSPAAQAAGILAPYPGFRGSVSQALRPYPQFSDIQNLYQPIGWSKYHSLQLRLQKRYSSGLSLLAAYTLSKDIVSGGGYTGFGDSAASARPLDTNNRALERRLAAFDMPQNLIVSWTYELPFGQGKRFASTSPRGANLLISGWVVNAIQRYASGTPLSVSGGGVIPLASGGNRPNRVAGVAARTDVGRGSFDPARDRYLNISAFSQPAPFTLGNAAPVLGDVRAFGLLNEDFSVLKDFRIHEAHRLEFRAEFFNVLNRVVFGSPAANLNAPASFGRIGGQANSPRHTQFGLKYIF
ncbi:MAG TPA: carboxypeptidase regulatory-like domain-containing protein [Bryobacteraceae bacterium]|nr:carboxypeptidase regulatory-like domain-containing protein [Bryobacteraceae bacterium]